MRDQQLSPVSCALLASLCLAFVTFGVQGQSADTDVPQLEIEQNEPETAVEEYMQTMALVDGLRVYNAQQERLLENQKREIAQINASIENVTHVRRQIGPLTERMIDSLERFIELDLPFLLEERRARIQELRATLDRADKSVAEKYNEVLKAYQDEIKYGNTKEAYVDFIEVNGQTRQVDILRWGRTVLAFQTPDGEITGAWDNETKEWKILGDEYRIGVRNGLRIARETMTSDLVILPTPAPRSR